MIVTPYSRRIRLFGGLTVLALIATYIHIRPTWRERSYEYAREFSETVSSYFGGDAVNNTLYLPGNEGMVAQYHNFSSPCASFPNTDGILLVMKTGATEAFDKVPTHLLTTLQCLPDFLLFSDMVRSSNSKSPSFISPKDTANKPKGATNRQIPHLRRSRRCRRDHQSPQRRIRPLP